MLTNDRPARTLADVVAHRASATPDRIAYTFHAGDDIREMTYAELAHRSLELAERLAETGTPGDRVLLLPSPGPNFVVGFVGTILAGRIAVPTYPPTNARNLGRLAGVVADARPVAVVADAPVLGLLAQHGGDAAQLSAVRTVEVDTSVTESGIPAPFPALPVPDDIAFLQYTSGSTGDPKGVVVTHRNLGHNSWLIAERMALNPDSVCVSWLPPYHDMGLVGGVLQPLYSGFHGVLVSPLEFLQHPLRWLRLVSEHRATVSGGPDFAFELCVRARGSASADLDLSSWRVAFSGSEPVRKRTLDRFAAHFAGAGFDPRAWYPCYGMAETTLFVSGGPVWRRPVTLSDDTDGDLVSCGGPHPDLDVRVVDPATGAELAGAGTGEIVVAGESVSPGYWNGKRPEAFGLRLPGAERPFLRTGDLGMLRDGELFVTGRIKDVLIIRGRNHYPQDVEECAQRSHEVVRANGVAAFTAPVDGEERLVVAAELADQSAARPAVAAIRRLIAEELGLHAHAVVALRPRSLARTANGKLRRAECRRRYLAGEFAERGAR